MGSPHHIVYYQHDEKKLVWQITRGLRILQAYELYSNYFKPKLIPLGYCVDDTR